MVLALAASEILLRRIGIVESFFASSASRGWRLRPGAHGWQTLEGRAYVSINAGGFRGPRAAPTKPPETTRVVVLGDSFAEAIHVPYEQSFCAVLKTEMEKQCAFPAGRRVEVLDFGVSGYGTAQELLTWREDAERYAPDVVVLAIVTGNDISDNSPSLDSSSYLGGERCRPYFTDRDGSLVLTGALRGARLMRWYCGANLEFRRSVTLQLIGQAVQTAYAMGEAWQNRARGIPGSEPGLDDAIYAPPTTAAWRQAWDITEGLITTVAREVEERHARFLAVILSNPVQVYPDPAYRRRYLAAAHGSDLFYPEHRLQVLGARQGFRVLALAPMMQVEADREHVFFHGFPNTRLGIGHWNARGHEFAGQAIAQALCGQVPSTRLASKRKFPKGAPSRSARPTE